MSSSLTSEILLNYLSNNFVETGIGNSGGASALAYFLEKGFFRIYGCDTNNDLIKQAHQFFLPEKTNKIISIECINSLIFLPNVLQKFQEKDSVTIWLDAHCVPILNNKQQIVGWKAEYSPILSELSFCLFFALHKKLQTKILIDDIRIYKTQNDLYGYVSYSQIINQIKIYLPKYNELLIDSKTKKNDILVINVNE